MGIFDDRTNPETLRKEQDEIVLMSYRISNSGATLIPRDLRNMRNSGMFVIETPGPLKLPEGTLKEENSIFKTFIANRTKTEVEALYPKYLEIIRGMGLKCIIYNGKRYYGVNREIKRQIARKLFN